MIKVLVVDDSPVARDFLVHVLSRDPALKVVGTARDGEEALAVVAERKPDVITMDIRMPKMNGLEATRLIMERYPTPIVIVSGTLSEEENASFRAVEAGALAVLQRPAGPGHPDHEATAGELVRTVRLMSEVKVVKRWSSSRLSGATPVIPSPAAGIERAGAPAQIKLVAIGASTGGPVILHRILKGLPKDFPLPLLIVQHIAAGFVQGFAEWLNEATGFAVAVATHNERLLPGRAYVAPDNFHLEVAAVDRIMLVKREPENGLRPSVSALFRSVSQVYGKSAVGVLLTGMGKDGAHELLLMKERGAITLAQDKESSVIHGMPGEAVSLGAATYVLSPEGIAALLTKLAVGKSDGGDQG